jgi:RraA family protein
LDRKQVRLGLVGFGEVGSTVGKGVRDAGLDQVLCYDKAAFEGLYSHLIQSRASEAGVKLVRSQQELAAGADLIIGFTPGSCSIDSAKAFASVLTPAHVFVDFASATPKVKMAVADALKFTGAKVGDGSILGNPSNGYAMPMLVSGSASEDALASLVPWGMRIEKAGDRLGVASGIKILRSVLFKGIEALFDEMILAARVYEMDEAVLASAFKTLDRNSWAEILSNVVPSGAIHAERRAEELEMAADAVAEAGIEPIMARAGASRLRWKANLGIKQHFAGVMPKTNAEVFEAIEHLMKISQRSASPGSPQAAIEAAANDPTAEVLLHPRKWSSGKFSGSMEGSDGSVPGYRANPPPMPVAPDIVQAFEDVAVANISDSMNRLHGTCALRPFHKTRRLIGTAVTVKTRPGDNQAIIAAFENLRPGDVLVVDGGGDLNHALVGRLLMSKARCAGVAGFVIDGAIRDVSAFEEADFPCFARGVTHRGPFKLGPGELNIPVAIDGMIVNPGDLIIGDEDGLIAFNSNVAEGLLPKVRQLHQRELQILREIESGDKHASYPSE